MQQTSIQRQQNAIRQENGKRRIDRKRRRIRQIRRRCLCLFAILLILAALLTHLSTVQEVVVRLAQGLVTGKTLEKEDYPQSLIDLYERNAEARQFVLDYKTKKDDNTAIDVSADVNAGEIPLFLQWDERWGVPVLWRGFSCCDRMWTDCTFHGVCGAYRRYFDESL